MKKATVTLMACVLAASSCYAVPAFAAESTIEQIVEQMDENISVPYAYKYFEKRTVDITSEGNGYMNIGVQIRGTNSTKEIHIKKIIVQKKNNSGWTNVKTFTESEYPEFRVRDSYLGVDVTFKGIKGATYKALVIAEAGNGYDWETTSFYSFERKV